MIEVFRRAHPDIVIQAAGAITLENASQLLTIGVNRLAIGSALWKAPNLAKAIAQFEQLAEEYGRYR